VGYFLSPLRGFEVRTFKTKTARLNFHQAGGD
jgi:hypothetical protein